MCDRHKYSPELMRESKVKSQADQDMSTRAKSKRPNPSDEVRPDNSRKRSRRDSEGSRLCKDNPGKRVLHPVETEDITFTFKEMRAVKCPRLLTAGLVNTAKTRSNKLDTGFV